MSLFTIDIQVLLVSMFYSTHNGDQYCHKILYHLECIWQVACQVHKCKSQMCCKVWGLPWMLCSNHTLHHCKEELEDQSRIFLIKNSISPMFLKPIKSLHYITVMRQEAFVLNLGPSKNHSYNIQWLYGSCHSLNQRRYHLCMCNLIQCQKGLWCHRHNFSRDL